MCESPLYAGISGEPSWAPSLEDEVARLNAPMRAVGVAIAAAVVYGAFHVACVWLLRAMAVGP